MPKAAVMLRFVSVIAILLVFAAGLLFAVHNAGPVAVDYLWGSVRLPLSYVALGGCVVGLLLGFAGCMVTLVRLRRDNRRLRRKVRSATEEVGSLRRAPLQDVR